MRNTLQRLAIVTAAALLASCGKDSHSHDHEEKTAQVTVWTDRYEVFAEFKPVVSGQPATFITHVTDLVTLEPRREGMVKFILRGPDGSAFEHPQAEPARAGIYLPAITFPKPGEWSVSLLVPTDGTNYTVDLGKVQVFGNAVEAAKAEFSEPPEGISFLKEQQWKILSKSEPAAKRHLVERVRLPAQVTAKPGTIAVAMPPAPGRVLAIRDKGLPLPGERVEKGQVLALVEPVFSEQAARFFAAEADAGRAKAALEQAQANFTRIEKLAAENAKSPRELQEAQAALLSAKAEFEAAAALQATYRTAGGVSANPTATGSGAVEVRAPISGIVSDFNFRIGEHIASERPLFTIVNSEVVWLEANVPEGGASRLSKAAGALFEIPRANEKDTRELKPAKFMFLGQQIAAGTRTVPITFEADNQEGNLRIGQALDVFVETARSEEGVAVPESAIVEEDGNPIAFVQVSGETFQKRELKLGIQDGSWVQVLSGVEAGERVVTKGAYAIRLSSVSGVIPAHGHAH